MLPSLCRTTLLSSFVASAAFALRQDPTVRVNLGPGGVEANGDSLYCDVSADGRQVVYASAASNLVAGDGNGAWDVFVCDVWTGTTARASVDDAGAELPGGGTMPALSNDGRCVLFRGGASGLSLRDLSNSSTEEVNLDSNGALGSLPPSTTPLPPAMWDLSSDGRFVVFTSLASDLVPGDTNQAADAFLRDRALATTERVSLTWNGGEANGPSSVRGSAISDDGRFVAFFSDASNLVTNDGNNWGDLFVRDRLNGTTEMVSLNWYGVAGHLGAYGNAISADGRFVVFFSESGNMVPGDMNNLGDFFVRDRWLATTDCASSTFQGEPKGGSRMMSISADGRFVAIGSLGWGLVPGDTNGKLDVVIKDRATGVVRIVSRASSGELANGDAQGWALSSDGRTIAFVDAATNLTASDTNGERDVFVHSLVPTAPSVYCTPKTSSLGCVPSITSSGTPSVSSPAPFDIAAHSIHSATSGTLYYAYASNITAFQGGYLCLQPPRRRTGLQPSGGGGVCSGTFTFDFNALVQAGVDPALIAGTLVDAQYFFRDPGASQPIGLSDALHFAIGN